MMTFPTRDQVASVMVAVDVESFLVSPHRPARDEDEAERFAEKADALARRGRDDYVRPFIDVLGDDLVDAPDEMGESEYDGSQVYYGKVFAEMTLEQWLRVADAFCFDMDDDEVVPERYVAPTMGILTGEGIVPAVEIEGTEEGFGDFSGEPVLVASFYVALRVHEDV